MNMSLNPAFVVSDLDDSFDPNKSPTSGAEYLMKVIYERQRCPEIVTVPIDQNKIRIQDNVIPLTSEKVSCHEHLLPSLEWQQVQLYHFNQLRLKIDETVEKHGGYFPPPTEEVQALLQRAIQFKEDCESLMRIPPTLDLVVFIPQRVWYKLFKKQVLLLEELLTQPRDKTETRMYNLCLWIYAGLTCLQYPLEPQMHDMLRQVAKACAMLRATFGENDLFEDTIQLSIPICIIARAFNQRDLEDVRAKSQFGIRIDSNIQESGFWNRLGINLE